MKRIIVFLSIFAATAAIIAGVFIVKNNFAPSFTPSADPLSRSLVISTKTLTIGVANLPASFESAQFNPVSRSVFINTAEGLVSTNENLTIKTGLAVSWGRIDDNTWEFTLRPEIYFHNGQKLTAEDVIASLERARTHADSELRSLLATIQEVQRIDDLHLRILTKKPDPLLLQKLAVTPIVAGGNFEEGKIIGTGPYHIIGTDPSTITLERFDAYWGQEPYFKTVIFKNLPSSQERIDALEQGTIDLLVNVPPSIACSRSEQYATAGGCISIKNQEIVITSIPGLQVDFLAFNHNHEVLKIKEARQAITKVLDQEVLQSMTYGFATPASQFVSNGVFGYNPELTPVAYDFDEAKGLINKALRDRFEQPEIVFDYPQELQGLGQYITQQLQKLGIVVILNPLSSQELQQKVMRGESDFYFLGWRSELGDAADFLTAVAHSRSTRLGYGQFNGNNYSNPQLDDVIEEGVPQFDPVKRLKLFQQAMLLLKDDVMGVPLYQSETIFAYNKNLDFTPRIDGYVVVAEIKEAQDNI